LVQPRNIWEIWWNIDNDNKYNCTVYRWLWATSDWLIWLLEYSHQFMASISSKIQISQDIDYGARIPPRDTLHHAVFDYSTIQVPANDVCNLIVSKHTFAHRKSLVCMICMDPVYQETIWLGWKQRDYNTRTYLCVHCVQSLHWERDSWCAYC
jgi:hypothetical protein